MLRELPIDEIRNADDVQRYAKDLIETCQFDTAVVAGMFLAIGLVPNIFSVGAKYVAVIFALNYLFCSWLSMRISKSTACKKFDLWGIVAAVGIYPFVWCGVLVALFLVSPRPNPAGLFLLILIFSLYKSYCLAKFIRKCVSVLPAWSIK